MVAFRAQARSGADGTCRWKALRAYRVGAALAGGPQRRSWLTGTDLGNAGEGVWERQGVPASQPTGRVRGVQCRSAQRARDTERPFGAVRVAAAGGAASTASPPRVAKAGNGRAASSWTVAFWKLGRRLGRKGEAGCGGRKGESPKLGSSAVQRVLVTTSRLQRLVRSILSWTSCGTSVSWGGRE
jgi:hypothetical protein